MKEQEEVEEVEERQDKNEMDNWKPDNNIFRKHVKLTKGKGEKNGKFF